MRVNLIVVAATLALFVGTAFAGPVTNALVNPGFETGNFNGWTIGGNSAQTQVNTDGTPISGEHPQFVPTFQNVRSGQFAANALVRTSPRETVFLDQTVSVVAGQTYNVGFWVGVDSPNQPGYGFGSSLILVNGAALSLNNINLLQGPTPADFKHVFGSFTAGASQTLATVSFRIDGSGTGRAGFSLDDLHFTGQQAPEPASLALLGLGVLAVVRKRRKKTA